MYNQMTITSYAQYRLYEQFRLRWIAIANIGYNRTKLLALYNYYNRLSGRNALNLSSFTIATEVL